MSKIKFKINLLENKRDDGEVKKLQAQRLGAQGAN